MNKNENFTLRDGRPSDLLFLNAFNYNEGMDVLSDVDRVVVAADADDDPVAYIRIAIGSSGRAFVNPIVTNPAWRGQGVGRVLIEDALSRYGELRLVSRGSSIGFYKKLGFEECPWDEIDDGVSEDCAHCTMRAECGPLPMYITSFSTT